MQILHNTLRIHYEYTQKQCLGVAIEGMDVAGSNLGAHVLFFQNLDYFKMSKKG